MDNPDHYSDPLLTIVEPIHEETAEADRASQEFGLLWGDAAYTEIGVRSGTPLLLEESLQQLSTSAEVLGISLRPTVWHNAVHKALNDLRGRSALIEIAAAADSAVVRARPLAWPTPTDLGSEQLDVLPAALFSSLAWTTSRGSAMTARRHAQSVGHHDAVIVNSDGYIVEGSEFHLLWVEQGWVHFPDSSLGVTPSPIDAAARKMLTSEKYTVANFTKAKVGRLPGTEAVVGLRAGYGAWLIDTVDDTRMRVFEPSATRLVSLLNERFRCVDGA